MQKSAVSLPSLSVKTDTSLLSQQLSFKILFENTLSENVFLKVKGHLLFCSQEFLSRCQKTVCFNYTLSQKIFHTL